MWTLFPSVSLFLSLTQSLAFWSYKYLRGNKTDLLYDDKFQDPHPQASDRGQGGQQPLSQQLAAVGPGAVHGRPASQQLQQDHAVGVHIRLLAELPCTRTVAARSSALQGVHQQRGALVCRQQRSHSRRQLLHGFIAPLPLLSGVVWQRTWRNHRHLKLLKLPGETLGFCNLLPEQSELCRSSKSMPTFGAHIHGLSRQPERRT